MGKVFMSISGNLLVIGVLTLMTGFCNAENGKKDYAMLQNVSTQVATPHFPWGSDSPFQDKTVLFLAPYGNGREIVELWQRMPFQYESVLYGVYNRKDITGLG